MKVCDVEKELREIGKEPLPEVPEIVRRRQDEVYASLADLPMQDRSGRTPGFRKTRRIALVAASAAAIILVGGLGGAMVSPAMAESMKNIPLLGSIFKLAGDLGLQTADEKGIAAHLDASVTHEGVTLRIPQLVYDGTRLSLAVTREGGGFAAGVLDAEFTGNGKPEIYPEGAINSVDVYIDGEAIYNFGGGRKLLWGGNKTHDRNSAIYELTAFPTLDETPILPDEFQLRVEFRLEGISEPFAFELPIRKNAETLALSPLDTREWRGNKVTVEQIQFTPITTKVRLSVLSSDKEAKLLRHHLIFEVWDDQGRVLDHVSGVGVYRGDDEMVSEFLFERFTEVPASVTIKAFLPEMEIPGAVSGRFKLDSGGEIIKNYIKELEMTIPVDRTGLEKLYDLQN